MKLTSQERLVVWVAGYLRKENKVPPTVEEMHRYLPQWTVSALYHRVQRLRLKQICALERRDGQRSRVVVLTPRGQVVYREEKEFAVASANGR